MTALLMRAALAVLLALTALIGLIRAQPDSPSVDFLRDSADCAAPCFLGVRPGETDYNTALALLQANPYGGALTSDRVNRETASGVGVWSWGADSPVARAGMSEVWLTVRNGIVWNITLPNAMPYGEAWLVFGKPTRLHWNVVDLRQSRSLMFQHFTLYQEQGVTTTTRMTCPAGLGRYWGTPTTIQFGQAVMPFAVEMTVLNSYYGEYNLAKVVRQQKVCHW